VRWEPTVLIVVVAFALYAVGRLGAHPDAMQVGDPCPVCAGTMLPHGHYLELVHCQTCGYDCPRKLR
jgi:hypothetical protein